MEELLSEVQQRLLDKGFNEKIKEEIEGEIAELLYSDGSQKSIYCRVYPEDHEWSQTIKEVTITEGIVQPKFPTFAWATNGESNFYIDMAEEKSVTKLPDVSELETVEERELDAREKWSNQIYQQLQEDFDELHKTIFSKRDHVDNTNEAIDEFCKLIFMEVFRLNHPNYELKSGQLINEVVNHNYVKENPEKAIEDIREAFKEVKGHPDYLAAGEYSIFEEESYIRLKNPTIYEEVFDTLQNLGQFRDDNGEVKEGTLTDVSGDVLGRVFDVLLRGKFENKGGMGIYLTPRQVTEAMVDMTFNDLKETGKIIAKDADGKPELKVGDPTCGSGGFLVGALNKIEKYISQLGGWSDEEKEEHLQKLKENSFVGADNSPGMILKARINMALHGSPRAQFFKVRNSLTTDKLEPETFDLILTNPPFGKEGAYKKKNKEDKKILEKFSTDIVDKSCQMQSDKLALGSKNYSNGWRLNSSVEPQILFIDRCLQLLKPGGLLGIVLPDGVLSNSGEQYVREYLMGTKNEETGEFEGGKAIIKAVVSLPTETFKLSGTGTKTSFLYLKKKEHQGEKQGPVFMAVADKVGFEVKRNVEIELGDDHNDLLDIVEGYKR
ncbi:SAM-dependent methyltransferase [Natroniella acetigena]|uniref:HsdM family class I SAM-dependent methyltransferase n=1 Tax=Natroniella acetigena TaxID=52004 RepID=UPI002009F018|nr:N-6 DNA methylase [Natroniella acetigena]MCK8827812.1 SAM-dependent methyltransferase [Natroniella acetigena]